MPGQIIIDFPKDFDLVPHDRLPTKLAVSGVDSRVVVWVREFLVGRKQSKRCNIKVRQHNKAYIITI